MAPYPYLILGALLAFLVAGAGGYLWGRTDGREIERVQWQARDSEALRQTNAALNVAHQRNRDLERQHADQLATVSATYQKEIADANTRKDRALADLRRGTLKLRDPAAAGSACSDGLPQAGTGAARRDGGTTGKLSRKASEFLLSLAAEADAIAKQLAACQAIVRRDRATDG